MPHQYSTNISWCSKSTDYHSYCGIYRGKAVRPRIRNPSRPTPGVLRRFETALLYPRPNPREIIFGRLLPSHALPPTKLDIYFEWVSSSVTTAGVGQNRSRVSRMSIVGTPAGGQVSKAVGVACLELGVSVRWPWWWTVLFESYWRLHAWSCELIGHLVSPWRPRGNHNG
jgi:hypothetical protein